MSQPKKQLTDKKSPGNRLVAESADRLRDLILARPEGEQIGSLSEVAAELGVGIVTVQQAARILEHEGLLSVKRGPGGGYYGTRPDHTAIERAFATYMRVHNIGYREAFELTVLLDCDIFCAAASGLDDIQAGQIRGLIDKLQAVASAQDCIRFEIDLRETLFAFSIALYWNCCRTLQCSFTLPSRTRRCSPRQSHWTTGNVAGAAYSTRS